MTLDEAIEHCLDKAKCEQNKKCGLEHAQLAEWLKELKDYREEAEKKQKHGKWDMFKAGYNFPSDVRRYEYCSICGHRKQKGASLSRCPSCNAIMDK